MADDSSKQREDARVVVTAHLLITDVASGTVLVNQRDSGKRQPPGAPQGDR